MPMKYFASDNYASIHPEVMAAIVAANHHHAPAYGSDADTDAAVKKFNEQFGNDFFGKVFDLDHFRTLDYVRYEKSGTKVKSSQNNNAG